MLAISLDGRHLAYTRERDRRIVIHDTKTGKTRPMRMWQAPEDPLSVYFSPNGRYVAAQSGEGRPLHIMKVKTGRASSHGVEEERTLIGYSTTGPILGQYSSGGATRLHFLSHDARALRSAAAPYIEYFWSDAISTDGRWLIYEDGEGFDGIFNIASGKKVETKRVRPGEHVLGWISPTHFVISREGEPTVVDLASVQ